MNKTLNNIKELAKKGADQVDVEALKQKASKATDVLTEKAMDLKDAAVEAKDNINEKLTELDRMLEQSVTDYNDAYTLMNDKGIRLYVERCRSVDLISHIEDLVNSIANHPKYFDADFEEIETNRSQFIESCEFADRELHAARIAASGAGAGLAAGASVAFMAPTAAMWIATTFGTASTGAAISTLSGAAATNAALAWLGGGALAAGGSGMAGGTALLALSGPIGWGIAGASLLGSIVLLANKRTKLNKEKNEEIEKVKKNTELVKEMDIQISAILSETENLRNGLSELYTKASCAYGRDYTTMDEEIKYQLGALVNTTKSLSVLFKKTIGE